MTGIGLRIALLPGRENMLSFVEGSTLISSE